MEERFNQREELILKEERIKSILNLRKIKLNQIIFKARQRRFDVNSFKEKKEDEEQKIKERANNNEKEIILKFNEDDYFIDPDSINLNEELDNMKFVQTDDIINNITELLNKNDDENSIMYGVLMMRKFTVIEAVLINKSRLFIKNKLFKQIMNILNTYYNVNKKITFECLWILSCLVYDSKNKDMYYFLLNDKCIDLYKKIILFYCENTIDTNILKVISTFILNILIFKQKEFENDNNIINCDLSDDYLLDFLNGLANLIISLNIHEEIYISLLIEITNCFDFQILLKNDLLNKIIIFLINETLVNLENRNYYYEDEVGEYYENFGLNSKIRINSIYQIILIQLQYFMVHPLKEMPSDDFKKLSEEIINKLETIKDDKKHVNYYVEYINAFIFYLIEINLPLTFEETKKIFDFFIYFLKNKSKNKEIIISCVQGLNNLSTKMALNKMIGFLITEIPFILNFIKAENHTSLQIINEVFDLLMTLLMKIGLKIHNNFESVIFNEVIDCLKELYDCEINNDVKKLFENGYIIISKIIESNEKKENQNNYKFIIETKGIKDIISNLINLNKKIEIPMFLLNFLEINI